MIDLLPNDDVRITLCGGVPNEDYYLLGIEDLNWATSIDNWNLYAIMQVGSVYDYTPPSPPPETSLFFQLYQPPSLNNIGPPDFYVAPYATLGADGSKDLPFPSLQDALTSPTVPDGSIIQVMPGTYMGPTNRNLTFGGRNMTLVAERGWERTIIDCEFAPGSRAFTFDDPASVPGVLNAAPDVLIMGFTIRNAMSGAVFSSSADEVWFAYCNFVGNASGTSGGAVSITDSDLSFFNCQFLGNSTTGSGGAIHATGQDCRIHVASSTFKDNARAIGGGSVNTEDGAVLTIANSILWTTASGLGTEAATTGGAVAAWFCDIKGGYPGTGIIDADPLFESIGSTRLTANSPCIDQGGPFTFLFGELLVRHDMDGENRLDHTGFANLFGTTTDLGADEFVYRLQFPTVMENIWATNAFDGGFQEITRTLSEVDEASGVTYLGSNPTGPLISVVDDEDRTGFRIYQLNADASSIVSTMPISTLNVSYPDPGEREITDMEGLTFDPGTGQLYLITSQTKRNRYRDVDSSPPILDPLSDPPSNDYDRRRSVLVRMQLDASLTSVTSTSHFESEDIPVPYNTGHEPLAGLAAFLRTQFTGNPALGAISFNSQVLIAVNAVPKFGNPMNGHSYPAGSELPYSSGGPNDTAGTSLGTFAPSGSTTIQGFTADSINFFKIWAVEVSSQVTNYYPGPMVCTTNNGIPVIQINEFEVAGDNETIELYNPSAVAVDIGGFWISDNLFSPARYRVPDGTTISGRGVWSINNVDEVPFGFKFNNSGEEPIVLTWSDQVTELDYWNMQDPNGSISEGRVWDGGPRGFKNRNLEYESCVYQDIFPVSPYPPNLAQHNHPAPRKTFDAVADINRTDVHFTWEGIGDIPPVWQYSPKQHDFHSINIEDIAFRSSSEMILGLRAPLANRTKGNAYYFRVSNVGDFLSGPWTAQQPVTGISGPHEMDLGGLGIRSIKWCPQLGPGGVGRYLIVAGNANGGPLIRENARQLSALYAWDGTSSGNVASPQVLIPDLFGYAVRPEGVDLINVGGVWRVLFVEDRFQSEGYATRNAIHWPLSILGMVD